jgi:hypothetical protein
VTAGQAARQHRPQARRVAYRDLHSLA